MTDEEFREKIARLLMLEDTLSVDVPATCHYDLADQIHKLYEQAGWVQLAKDQSLPQVTETARNNRMWVAGFTCAIAEMLKTNFRKVEDL